MGKRAKGLLAVLLCVHCSATLLVTVAALLFAGTTAPLVFGVPADRFLVPLGGFTLFLGWIWWGHRKAARDEACLRPPAPAQAGDPAAPRARSPAPADDALP